MDAQTCLPTALLGNTQETTASPYREVNAGCWAEPCSKPSEPGGRAEEVMFEAKEALVGLSLRRWCGKGGKVPWTSRAGSSEGYVSREEYWGLCSLVLGQPKKWPCGDLLVWPENHHLLSGPWFCLVRSLCLCKDEFYFCSVERASETWLWCLPKT